MWIMMNRSYVKNVGFAVIKGIIFGETPFLWRMIKRSDVMQDALFDICTTFQNEATGID
jgi:hypothetical protein